jgi:hypothetical protein
MPEKKSSRKKSATVEQLDAEVFRLRSLEVLARHRDILADKVVVRDNLAAKLRTLFDDTVGGPEYAEECSDIASQWARAVEVVEMQKEHLDGIEEYIAELEEEIVSKEKEEI